MTAIAGIINYRHDLPLSKICAAALAAQSAYGDGKAVVRCTDDAALGINLLSTLPEDRFDCQPLVDDRHSLVADVRLDNRDEVLAQLGLPRLQFVEQSDAAILMLAWKRWGADCLNRIVGDFAFAIYDRHQRQLTLARDPTGSRPLCYGLESEGLRFASMPSGVVEPSRLKPDLTELSIRLSDRALPGRTCFENIDAVPPGELIRFSPLGLAQHRYWQPQRHYDRDRTPEQTAGELRERLDEAVRARMRSRSDVIASHLSSGYDSSAVTGTASKFIKAGERLVALTSAPSPGLSKLEFRGRISDESFIAASTASALGIEHVIVRDGSPLLDAMRGHARIYQQPVGNVFNQGWWAEIARTAASMNAEIMLSGAAGNFTVSHGSLSVLPYWLRSGHWFRWLAEARAAKCKNDVRWRGLMMASFDPWLPRQLVDRIASKFQGAPDAEETRFHRRKREHTQAPARLTGDPFCDRLTMIRTLDFGLNRKGLLAETGMEERDPTSDRRLVEFCLSMPPEHLLANGTYRPVARIALADRVPGHVLDQRARGYQGADWFARLSASDMNEAMEEISASSAGELLNLPKMSEVIARWSDLTSDQSIYISRLGRSLTDALAAGLFIAEVERDPLSIGRADGDHFEERRRREPTYVS